jgi:single-strand DNA-binding protein
MSTVCKVIIIGNVGKDPEIKTFQNGKIANLSVATSKSWKDKNSGERKEKSEWHRICIRDDRLVDVAERFVKKGVKLYLEGELESRKYTDQQGVERYIVEVVVPRFTGVLTLLDGRSDGGNAAPSESQSRATTHPKGKQQYDDMDDPLPF